MLNQSQFDLSCVCVHTVGRTRVMVWRIILKNILNPFLTSIERNPLVSVQVQHKTEKKTGISPSNSSDVHLDRRTN